MAENTTQRRDGYPTPILTPKMSKDELGYVTGGVPPERQCGGKPGCRWFIREGIPCLFSYGPVIKTASCLEFQLRKTNRFA